MGFVIKKQNSFTWPVKIKIPVDGGKYETSEINIKFKSLTQKELKEITSHEKSDDKTICEKIIVGWSGVTDEQGSDVEFTLTNLDTVLNIVGVSTQIAGSYLNIYREAAIKN